MLNYLHIENIAVIELSDITFSTGFNVMTGETGAGKSIIIDSLNAVLGARTSRELIRNGCSFAKVSAEFSDIGADAENALAEAGFSKPEDGKLIIIRTLTDDGKSTFRVNGEPANASTVREISKYLLNIHGQHDNQSLLDPDKHCGFIDKLANNESIREEYLAEFKNLVSIRKELQLLEMDEDEKLRRIDLLNYQINELEGTDIKVGEYDDIKEKLRLAQNFEKNIKNLNNAVALLKGTEEAGICEKLNDAIKLVSSVNSEKLSKVFDKLSEISENLDDCAADLAFTVEKEFDTELDAAALQDRLDSIKSVMLKYGGTEKAALDYLSEAKADLDKIKFSDKKIEELETALDKSEKILIEKAAKLTESRKIAAAKFERDVCESLRFLDMPSVKFKVDFKPGKYTKNGCDVLEFMISANAGEDVKPLAKIASGGELSRVMLAIKSIIADKDEVRTMIFDEIDTGISGRAATKVAYKLRQVSKNRQVICVTHLAQIAAYAADHLLIEKTTQNNKTFTTVNSLDYNDRIEELARIMSGAQMTKAMFDSAKELLDRSTENENL
ncbi:MAG: DNA repair protein RecN [Clostridiales bacterium]|nr:DNA repair protein RecN [Candidatus Equinaster intestinalis]